jgi:flagellar hook assembly protein FlgD
LDCAGNESEAASPQLLVGAASPVPDATRLVGARPNPFNPATQLVYDLAAAARVTLRVYDLRGRLVAEPVPARHQPAGRHAVDWRAEDTRGRALPSGRYLAVLTAGAVRCTTGVTLLR